MKNKFTSELLIKYLYHETTSIETLEVENALTNNWEVSEAFNALESSYRRLPKVLFAPKSSTIQNIIGYNNEKPAIEPYV